MSRVALVGLWSLCTSLCAEPSLQVVKQEWVFTKAPFDACHASTLVEIAPGILAVSWFGGEKEGAKNVGIWFSKTEGDHWSTPQNIVPSHDMPCWNPVLHNWRGKELLLFYKVGRNPHCWTGFLKRSLDGGSTWLELEILPAGILGPIKNKPLETSKGELLCGSSVESYQADGAWVEVTPDGGKTWQKFGPIGVPTQDFGMIQPTLFYNDASELSMLCRGRRGTLNLCGATSLDEGRTWSPVTITPLPCPDSGCDAIQLKEGPILLVYNHSSTGRERIDVALSFDGGKHFEPPMTLEEQPEEGELSYPAVIQKQDGTIALTYTHNRTNIRYIELRYQS